MTAAMAMAATAGTTAGALAEEAVRVPDSAFYAGIGVSANLLAATNQTMFAQGISNVTQGGVLAAYGAAGGPTNPRVPVSASVSPSAQVGWFSKLAEGPWMMGARLSYNYIGAKSSDDFLLVPQVGSYTLTGSGTLTGFTGNVFIRSYQISVDHQFALVPYAGYAFERSTLYFGVGPSLTRAQVTLADTVGFARINGVTQSITGTPTNYTSTQWLIGATFAAGATYYLSSSWFLDFGYSFTLTDLWNQTYASPFSNTWNGFTTSGILSGSYTGNVNTHALTLSINRRF